MNCRACGLRHWDTGNPCAWCRRDRADDRFVAALVAVGLAFAAVVVLALVVPL